MKTRIAIIAATVALICLVLVPAALAAPKVSAKFSGSNIVSNREPNDIYLTLTAPAPMPWIIHSYTATLSGRVVHPKKSVTHVQLIEISQDVFNGGWGPTATVYTVIATAKLKWTDHHRKYVYTRSWKPDFDPYPVGQEYGVGWTANTYVVGYGATIGGVDQFEQNGLSETLTGPVSHQLSLTVVDDNNGVS